MIIQKGSSFYIVTESKNKWKVTKDSGRLSLSVDVPKDLCKDEEELRKYVLTNKLF